MVAGIGSLLAEITGEKPSTGQSKPVPRAIPVPKRKPEDELRRDPVKSLKTGQGEAPNRALPRDPAPAALIRRSSRESSGSSAPTAPTRPPKKGSFAEIMARAQRAQQTMGQVGKIQHKRSGPPSTTAKRKPVPEPEAAKKARQPPTTGYAGTARPRPGAPSGKDRKKQGAGGVILNPSMSRYGADKRRSSRYEEDDEEMSDFIDYDDEEDEGVPSRHYYSDEGSSDMEAGLDEIDDEEEQAEYLAKQDDWREQQLEKKLKLEKERRKQEALASVRRR
ncbi:unnamed protein product [Parascedosporium putredinis]|uniref:SPT2 chromatin protein n=1 Tax=Parascedosporium putredinis TaxID=1442378 RepID=A0A9P1M9V3_9PEZI|nr:unnamed protein product [Parascedosporium putredinis]CAI7992808.1 unnamed protein product [Parascedosporium putredinis]